MWSYLFWSTFVLGAKSENIFNKSKCAWKIIWEKEIQKKGKRVGAAGPTRLPFGPLACAAQLSPSSPRKDVPASPPPTATKWQPYTDDGGPWPLRPRLVVGSAAPLPRPPSILSFPLSLSSPPPASTAASAAAALRCAPSMEQQSSLSRPPAPDWTRL